MARSSSSNSGSIPMILIDIGARSRDMPKGSLWRSAAIDIEGGKTVMSMQAFLRDREALLSGGARAVEIEPVYMGTYSLDPKTAVIVPKYQYSSMLLRHAWVAIGQSVYLVDFLVVDGAYYDYILGADFVHKLDGRYPWMRNGEWMAFTNDRAVKLDFSDEVWLKPGQPARTAPLWHVPRARTAAPTYNPSHELLTLEAEFLPVFRALDINYDGFVSRDELRRAMKNPWGGAPLLDSEFDSVWAQADPYQTGYLNQQQFLKLMGQLRGFFHSPSPYNAASSSGQGAAYPPQQQYAQQQQQQQQHGGPGATPQYVPQTPPEIYYGSSPQYQQGPGQGQAAQGQTFCPHCSPHTAGHEVSCPHQQAVVQNVYPLTTSSTTTTTTTTTFAPPPYLVGSSAAAVQQAQQQARAVTAAAAASPAPMLPPATQQQRPAVAPATTTHATPTGQSQWAQAALVPAPAPAGQQVQRAQLPQPQMGPVPQPASSSAYDAQAHLGPQGARQGYSQAAAASQQQGSGAYHSALPATQIAPQQRPPGQLMAATPQQSAAAAATYGSGAALQQQAQHQGPDARLYGSANTQKPSQQADRLRQPVDYRPGLVPARGTVTQASALGPGSKPQPSSQPKYVPFQHPATANLSPTSGQHPTGQQVTTYTGSSGNRTGPGFVGQQFTAQADLYPASQPPQYQYPGQYVQGGQMQGGQYIREGQAQGGQYMQGGQAPGGQYTPGGQVHVVDNRPLPPTPPRTPSPYASYGSESQTAAVGSGYGSQPQAAGVGLSYGSQSQAPSAGLAASGGGSAASKYPASTTTYTAQPTAYAGTPQTMQALHPSAAVVHSGSSGTTHHAQPSRYIGPRGAEQMLFPAQATQGGGGIGNTTCKAQPSAYMAPKGADQVLHPAQAAQGGSGTATYQAQPGAFVTPQGTQQVLYPSQTLQGKAGSTTYQAQPSAYLQGQGVNPNSQAEYSVTSLYPSQTAAAHAPGTPSRAQGGQHSGPQDFTLYPATVSQQGALQPQGAARGAKAHGVITLYASDAPPSSRR